MSRHYKYAVGDVVRVRAISPTAYAQLSTHWQKLNDDAIGQVGFIRQINSSKGHGPFVYFVDFFSGHDMEGMHFSAWELETVDV